MGCELTNHRTTRDWVEPNMLLKQSEDDAAARDGYGSGRAQTDPSYSARENKVSHLFCPRLYRMT